jgi:hypothetical protein
VTGDYSGLIELGKNILVDGKNAISAEIRKNWFVKSMKYIYAEVNTSSS